MTAVHLLFKKPKGTGMPPVRLVFGGGAAPAGVVGAGVGGLVFEGGASAAHGVAGTGAGALPFAGSGAGEHTSPAVEGVGAGALVFTGAGAAAHGVAGTGAGAIGFTGACAAVHLRYEVRGEVRQGGILVNRRVRCYKRSTGELMGQADTTAGLYRVHAGFDDAEVYTLAIHPDEAATDWIPPTANRLVPVLAEDAT